MNYEEKYNQALERATFYNNELPTKEQRKMLVDIFPELKESEDEKIRKVLLNDFKNNCSEYYCEGVNRDMIIAWLEKQKLNTSKREIDDAYLQGMCDAIHEIEKQGESAITNIEIPFGANDSELQEVSYDIPEGFYAEIKDDRVVIKKIEPKFKVRDWVILNCTVAQILDKQEYGFVGLDIDGKDFFCNYGHTDSMRLWSINDAKDGDVLYSLDSNRPFIYKERPQHSQAIAYCGISVFGKFFIWQTKDCVICLDHYIPATKEQRDLLFSKMKEAGYEWNADKKKLKKIEQKTLNAGKVIEWLNHHELSRDDVVTSMIPDDSPTSVPHRIKRLSDKFIKQFKKDFGL